MRRKFLHKRVDGLLGDLGAGGVVRVRDEDEAGVFRDGIRHGIEVVDEIRIVHLDVFRAEEGGHEFVNDEGVLRGDELRIAVQEGVA